MRYETAFIFCLKKAVSGPGRLFAFYPSSYPSFYPSVKNAIWIAAGMTSYRTLCPKKSSPS